MTSPGLAPSLGNPGGPGASKPSEATIDDRLLASRARAGDREAFARLVVLYTDRLHAMLLNLANGDRDLAAELTQEAFVRAFDRLDQFAGGSSFYTWLYRLARNRALDVLARKRPIAAGDEALERAADAPSPVDAVATEDLRARVREALATLPPETREILLMREFDGLDYDGIAEALGVPVGTVKSRLSRARAELRARLEGSVRAEDVS